MSGSPLVHAHAAEVDAVAHAVESFVAAQTKVLAAAKSSQRALAADVQAELADRRRRLDQARRSAAAAEAALARCQENCGGLHHAVVNARRVLAEAEHDLKQAKKAAEMVEQATAKLAATARRSERVTAEHGRAAVTACRDLASRLRSFLGHAAGGLEIAATIAHAGSQVGAVLPPGNPLAQPRSETTISARAEESVRDQQQLWADDEKLRLEKRNDFRD